MEWTSATGRTLVLMEGDITSVPADAIVNAANAALAGGGGVDGAIHRAGGPAIMRELEQLQPRHCPTGSAAATTAGNLPARYVFHAVGPVYRDGRHGEAELLASCYRTAMRMAEERGCASITFPAISAGVYGYPLREAAAIAVREVRTSLEGEGCCSAAPRSRHSTRRSRRIGTTAAESSERTSVIRPHHSNAIPEERSAQTSLLFPLFLADGIQYGDGRGE
jgi:O-acetyl-ADP-ribose deacetylase